MSLQWSESKEQREVTIARFITEATAKRDIPEHESEIEQARRAGKQGLSARPYWMGGN